MLTEEQAVEAFARAWNRLEPDDFLRLLKKDARYASQYVFNELVSASDIADYLREKMESVRIHGINNIETRVRVEVGRLSNGQPCALMTQGVSDVIRAVVVFEVDGERIVRYDLCMPELYRAIRTGVYPE